MHRSTVESPNSTQEELSPEIEQEQCVFTEPSLLKTGYLIALHCGHNGNWSREELKDLDVHLVRAAIIKS